jgi:hypothetical protein
MPEAMLRRAICHAPAVAAFAAQAVRLGALVLG